MVAIDVFTARCGNAMTADHTLMLLYSMSRAIVRHYYEKCVQLHALFIFHLTDILMRAQMHSI